MCTPPKQKCAFATPAGVRSLLVNALGLALQGAGHRASAGGGAATLDELRPNVVPFERPRPPAYQSGRGPVSFGLAEAMQAPFEAFAAPSADARAHAAPIPEALLDRPLGAARAQVHETYILAQTRDSLVIVDQHAAHERLVYERMKAMLAEGGVARQGLLIPVVVDLEPHEAEAIAERACELAELGLVVEAFGAGAVAVRETPALLGEADVQGLVKDLAADIAGEGSRARSQGAAGGGVRDACLPRQRARRAPARPGGDERAFARHGGDALLGPVQPRAPHLRRAEALRHRAAVRPALTSPSSPCEAAWGQGTRWRH